MNIKNFLKKKKKSNRLYIEMDKKRILNQKSD